MYLHDQKVKPYLITRSLIPENQETPIPFINFNMPVPSPLFYRRNHFKYPSVTPDNLTLKISGLVDRPSLYGYSDLVRLPSRTVSALLECSGNKRAFFKDKVFGDQWENGAISEGVWKGVPLSDLLMYSGLNIRAKEIVFRGRDSGIKSTKHTYYQRSLPISKALDPEVLVAYEYNGKPLPPKHGFPFRLIVPGWYGMASVKWLDMITVIADQFSGPFQTEDYVYYYENGTAELVTEINVNSSILQPLDKEILQEGMLVIKGIAWTGKGIVSKVEISFDKGQSWESAKLLNHPKQYQTVEWSFTKRILPDKEYNITVRAIDSEGRKQPSEGVWNKKGYGYNGNMQITVKAE